MNDGNVSSGSILLKKLSSLGDAAFAELCLSFVLPVVLLLAGVARLPRQDTDTIMDALDVVYEEQEKRGFMIDSTPCLNYQNPQGRDTDEYSGLYIASRHSRQK
jgi:hypothetical protein